MRSKSILPGLLVIFFSVPFYFAGSILGDDGGARSVVTFSKDVAPILYRHCAECHRPGNIAPMSLLTYQEAKIYARTIREKVANREMPPWHADARFGQFANERRLSPEEITKIARWVEQGAPEGDSRDLPPPPTFPERWSIGTPDVVLQMAEEHKLGAGLADIYVYFRIPTNFTEDKWVQAVEFRPGNRRVVHHAVAFIETPQEFAAAKQSNPLQEQGYSTWSLLDFKPTALELMEGTTRHIRPNVRVINDGCAVPDFDAVGASSSNTVLSVYAPGREADAWPPGVARKIPAGSNIILQMHYSKAAGETASDRTSVALIFARAPVEKMIGSRSINNFLFEIPPGAENHRVTACWEVQRDLQLLSFMPHMHVRGKSMRYEIAYPDGRRETVLYVPHYSFHWQTLYTLKKPLTIPAGARVIVTAYFDNSEKNPHNPDPSKTVRHGTATFDEMMIGFVDYIIPKPRPRVLARVDPAIYEAYAGRYAYNSTVTQSIIKIGDRLYAESGGQRVELYPSSETTFFLENADAEITFRKNERGEVAGFTITQNEKLLSFNKIGPHASSSAIR